MSRIISVKCSSAAKRCSTAFKEQADKLSSAFSSKDDIKQLLDDATLAEEFEFREMKREVRIYFKDIEQRLINVSHTIDRIKPKINKLYNDFEKRDFDRKIESFSAVHA